MWLSTDLRFFLYWKPLLYEVLSTPDWTCSKIVFQVCVTAKTLFKGARTLTVLEKRKWIVFGCILIFQTKRVWNMLAIQLVCYKLAKKKIMTDRKTIYNDNINLRYKQILKQLIRKVEATLTSNGISWFYWSWI